MPQTKPISELPADQTPSAEIAGLDCLSASWYPKTAVGMMAAAISVNERILALEKQIVELGGTVEPAEGIDWLRLTIRQLERAYARAQELSNFLVSISQEQSE